MFKVKIYDHISYRNRQRKANVDGAICFIAIHHNGFSDPAAHGAMAIVANNMSQKSYYLAQSFVEFNKEVVGISVRVSPRGDGVFLAKENGGRGNSQLLYTHMPAILTEALFLTNPQESKIACSEGGQRRLAHAIALAIRKHFPRGGLVAVSPGHNCGNKRNLYGTCIHDNPILDTGERMYEYHINRAVAEMLAKELTGVNASEVPKVPEQVSDESLELKIGRIGGNDLVFLVSRYGAELEFTIVEESLEGVEINTWEFDTFRKT